jgi:4'-phosphopantetheinyl transferase
MRFLPPTEVVERGAGPQAERSTLQVWPLLLDGGAGERAYCEAILSPAERQRAARFFHERDRTAFVFSHGLMRCVLAARCGVEPSALSFDAGPSGKPFLSPGCRRHDADVSFNLSHSHGRALLAVSDGREVGVDIEAVSPRTNVLGIASSYFCGPELAAIRNAPPHLLADTFFRYWSAKEAVLKAQGCGLGVPLDSFCVVFGERCESADVQTTDESRIAAGWRVRVLPQEPGWHAAVVACGDDWEVAVVGER